MYNKLKQLAQEEREWEKKTKLLREQSEIQLSKLFGELKMLPAVGETGSEIDNKIRTTLGDFRSITPITYYTYTGRKLSYLVRPHSGNDHLQNSPHQHSKLPSHNLHNGNLNNSKNSTPPQRLQQIVKPDHTLNPKLQLQNRQQSQKSGQRISERDKQPYELNIHCQPFKLRKIEISEPLLSERYKRPQELRLPQPIKSIPSLKRVKKNVKNSEKVFAIDDLLKAMTNPYRPAKPVNGGNTEKRSEPIRKMTTPKMAKTKPTNQFIPCQPITKQQLCLDLEISDSDDDGIDIPNIPYTAKIKSQCQKKSLSSNNDSSSESGFESSPQSETSTKSAAAGATMKCSIDLSRLARIPHKTKDTSIRCSIDLSRLPSIRHKLIDGSLQRRRVC